MNDSGPFNVALLKNIYFMNKLLTLFAFFLLCVFFSCKAQTSSEKGEGHPEVLFTGIPVSKLPAGVNVIFQDAQGNHWFGSEGVFKLSNGELTQFTTEHGLCGMSVIGIQQDQLGNLYFDTTEGVSKFDGQQFTTLEVIENAEWELNPNDLWFRMGWNHNGPFRYDGKKLHSLSFPETEMSVLFAAQYPNASYNPNGIYSSYQDKAGNWWFGTASLGVFRYDGETISWLYEEQMTKSPNGGDFGIRSIIEDRNGHFWFCNTGHRYTIFPAVDETGRMAYQRHDGTADGSTFIPEEVHYFMGVTEDNEGNLWMVTYDDGVSRYNGEKLSYLPLENNGEDIFLFTCYTDNDGVVWLGSHNAGAWRFNGEAFERFYVN